MTDETEIFALLTKLHAKGLLTDAELKAKKDALRNRRSNSSETTDDASQVANTGDRSSKTRYAYTAILGIAVLGFMGILIAQSGRPSKVSPPAPVSEAGNSGMAKAAASPSGDGWIASTERDPMTDVSYGQAITRISGQQSDAEILMRCGSDGVLSYTISTFDKDGQPAPMRMSGAPPVLIGAAPAGSSQTNPTRWAPGYNYIGYEIRAGSNQSVSMSQAHPQYNNQVKLVAPLGTPTAELLFQLAGGDTVTVRLPMPYGEETYQWFQAVEPFKTIATPCLLAQQKVHAESEARAKAAAEPPRPLTFPK